MSEPVRRRVGRPSTQVLSRVRIVETALDLLDEHGEGFGMRDLARELGVRPSALYNHVENKEDVFRGIREVIAGRVSQRELECEPWDIALAAWARSYRDAFAAHPPTIALLAVMPFDPSSEVFPSYERILALLIGEGWNRADALNILVALESFILGSALDAAAAPDMLHAGDRDDVPQFAAAYEERQRRTADTGSGPADQAFATGLDLMLLGLRAQQRERAEQQSDAAGAGVSRVVAP
ncbi:TetR/AcrR family transcriptional regulator C-terminal domain-containing protein [Leucobacter sp. NPDC077196]|uniref:TetR/AcrR family transcriptional regulator C-terminal domain-containing protein n=1 Tax=Leucobacter sp. NPDC077196 TaxID=3154959 RepID=UPI0034224DE8